MRPRLLVTNGFFLPMGGSAPFHGWMAVGDDGRISARGVGRPPAGLVGQQELDATGYLVAPGFVSAHSHLYGSGFRGLASDNGLDHWLETTGRMTANASVDGIYWSARHGAQDCLINGVTTVYDFCHNGLAFHPALDGPARIDTLVPSVDYQHAQLRAKADTGLRHLHSIMLAQVEDPGTLGRHLADTMARAADFAGHSTHLGLALTGTVQWAASLWGAHAETRVMRDFGLINQAHLLESARGAGRQRARFWWYEQAGALGPAMLFGHFIHTDQEIIDATAAAGGGMTWQPASNGRLGSGIADVPRYRSAGIRVGMGLDSASAGDVCDPWANMRAGLYLQRASHADPTCLGVAEVLEFHTSGAAELMGVGRDVGSLELGSYADFLVVDPARPSTGPVWDPYGTYVLACGPRNLAGVYVGGKLVADRDGLADREAAARVDDQLRDHLEPCIVRERAGHLDR